jgi:hypothetical protein
VLLEGRSPVSLAPAAPAPGRRHDLIAAASGLLLFAAVAVAGGLLDRHSHHILVRWPPLMARWNPHVGPGTPAAVAVAVLVVGYGPALARRLSWRALLWSSWAGALAWSWSLALVDGWQRGVAGRLTTASEYVHGVGHFHNAGSALRGFTGHILIGSPDPWEAHVIGHPPLAVLTFVGLDRIGLGGGAWAGVFCVTAGSTFVMAVLVTLRTLKGGGGSGESGGRSAEAGARAAAPFLVLTPGAIWVGVSADGYFAAVAAWALALLAVAATRTAKLTAAVAGLGSGLLFGAALYLSYGLTLLVVPAAVVLVCAARTRARTRSRTRSRPSVRAVPVPAVAVAAGLLGLAGAVLSFTLAGFDWWEAYGLLKTRYYQGWGGIRPYAYWMWGDLGATVAAVGLACVAGMRRALLGVPAAVRAWRGGRGGDDFGRSAAVETLLPCAFLLAMVAADLSGMSKAETERIWLPFTLWLPMTAALLPARDRRAWLIAQAVAALLLNHLLLTQW